MALRINTNVAALTAHRSMIKNDNALSASLEKLSSGLRINKAADDASGMAIADSLRSQALGLGQAIKNANDGISMVQTADGALDESINIINSVKTKAIQAAQDGQTTESRKAIQSDINKLLAELDIIAKTTAFNNQKLLSGNFTGKKFQVGAYSQETVDISIASAQSTKVGHVSNANLTVATVGLVELGIYSNLQNQTFRLESIDIQYNNSVENSLSALADSINKLSDSLGISATAVVSASTSYALAAGTTDANFSINGVVIGAVDVAANDSTGALVKAINGKTSDHGVAASVDNQGILTLSSDGRAISVTYTSAIGSGSGADAVFRGDDLSTLGYISLNQTGSGDIIVKDIGGGNAVNLNSALEVDGSMATTVASTLTTGSVVGSGSVLAAGWTTGQAMNLSAILVGTSLSVVSLSTLTTGSRVGSSTTLGDGSVLGATFSMTSFTTVDDGFTLEVGSLLTSASEMASGTTIGGTTNTEGSIAVVGTATLAAGTTLGSNTLLKAGTVIATGVTVVTTQSGSIVGDGTATTLDYNLTTLQSIGGTITAASGSTLSGTSIFTRGSLFTNNAVIVSGTVTLEQDMALKAGSELNSGTDLTAGSIMGAGGIQTGSSRLLTQDMTLAAGSTINKTSSSLVAGSTMGATATLSADTKITTTASFTLASGSLLKSATTLANGSTIGGTLKLDNDETVVSTGTMMLREGSVLESGSTIKADTYLTTSITGTNGTTYAAGTVLTEDVVLASDTTLAVDMTVQGGTILKAGTILAANGSNVSQTTSSVGTSTITRLSELNVLTQDGAQIAIAVADSALKDLDKVRSDLGSVQNQLISTISNLSATRVNIFAAESSIRDVDFAEEAANFSKLQILNQAGAFAMAQANASSQNVLTLLQG